MYVYICKHICKHDYIYICCVLHARSWHRRAQLLQHRHWRRRHERDHSVSLRELQSAAHLLCLAVSSCYLFRAHTLSLCNIAYHFFLLNLYHTCLGSTPRKTTSHLSRTPWLSAAIETIRGNSAARAAAFSAPRGDSTMELHGGEGRVLHPDSKLAGKELVGSESVRTRNSPDSAHHSARHCANADKAVCGHRRRERACAGCCAEQD